MAGRVLSIPDLPRRLTRRSRDSVRRILDAAARSFGRDGYQSASLSQVAKAAGVSKSLLHYHFDSKEHLLLEAQRAVLHRLWERFGQRLQDGRTGMLPALETLDSMWEAMVDLHPLAPFMIETIRMGQKEGPLRTDLEAFYGESMALLENGIREVFAEDAQRLRWPPERLAMLIRVFLHGAVVELAAARTPEDIDRLRQAWADCREAFVLAVLMPAPTQ